MFIACKQTEKKNKNRAYVHYCSYSIFSYTSSTNFKIITGWMVSDICKNTFYLTNKMSGLRNPTKFKNISW